ncbi:hypothetical protein A9264_05170 [Vibrio sp. UCD-FRSSP16_10]|uniref:DUF2919 domain-containing protein n=1 Tax=unclassified Vibrio TaxID=2614977 RepID=UPI0007FC6E36|nr:MULTISPECIES: DUF2919 domain-containing protein [unclassified Vibrio]OBT08629.1 hypothetical protein A9260_07410 [Vibrio sp. UCD-FRSSP16_30]OBT18159.1 hypothetical protein A9264_05170 [Vibrio sp. UCD-FRSSP16_10]
MRYLIEEYDKNGYLKAPYWLWLCWLFLARGWIVFVMAAATRDKGSDILAMIYPNSSGLYTIMAMGVPCLLLMWVMELRSPDRQWLNKLIKLGRPVTVLIAIVQLSFELYYISLQHGQFSWGGSLSVVGLSWIIIYLFNSRRVKDCFKGH